MLTIEEARQYLADVHARSGEAITIKSARHGVEDGVPLVLITFRVASAPIDFTAGIWREPNGRIYGEW